jgi:triosephosphate isomerase
MSVHSSRKRLVAGNWKLNGSLDGNSRLLQELLVQPEAQADCDVLVCVPYVYLPQVADILKESAIAVGAQDVSVHAKGAYTGEVSAAMLAHLTMNSINEGNHMILIQAKQYQVHLIYAQWGLNS